jgi:hypothetical protein
MPDEFLVKIDGAGQSLMKYYPEIPHTRGDDKLRQLSETETPLRGRGGRTYQLISTPSGLLAIGEGTEQRQQIITGYDRSGRQLRQHAVTRAFTPLLVPFTTGFYVVTQLFEHNRGNGIEVEKYVLTAPR